MKSTPRALIDTGAIYAFVTRTDRHHQKATDLVHRWLARQGQFLLADVVFAETMTLLKARLGSDLALRVGRELRRNPLYVWLPLGTEGEAETWATFQRFADKEWSYTDCAQLVLSRRTHTPTIFGFDDHFRQMAGITRVPA